MNDQLMFYASLIMVNIWAASPNENKNIPLLLWVIIMVASGFKL